MGAVVDIDARALTSVIEVGRFALGHVRVALVGGAHGVRGGRTTCRRTGGHGDVGGAGGMGEGMGM